MKSYLINVLNFIKQKKNIKLILIAIIILSIVLFIINKITHKKSTASASAIAKIVINKKDIFRVHKGPVEEIISFTGDLTPANQTIISSEINAQVLKVNVNNGDYVKKGQILAILDNINAQNEVNKDAADFSDSKLNFEFDRQKYEKNKELYEQGFISKIQFDELVTKYKSSKEKVIQKEAILNQSKKKLANAIVRAPFNGYIYEKYVENGQVADLNGKLFALANLDILQISAAIPSDDINRIQVGQKVRFSVENNQKEYIAYISRINPVANEGTHSYNIYADIDNKKYKLKSGQFIRGNIIVNSIRDALYVDGDAILDNDSTQYVLQIINNTIKFIPVKVLFKNNVKNIYVLTNMIDLKEDDLLLSNRANTVKAGDTITIESE